MPGGARRGVGVGVGVAANSRKRKIISSPQAAL